MNIGRATRKWAAVSVATAFLWSLFLGAKVFEFQGPVENLHDVRIARNLAQYGIFSIEEETPDAYRSSLPRPTRFHEPLYPLFLAALMEWSGPALKGLVPVQAAIHAATTGMAYLAAGRVMPFRWAWVASVLVAVDPSLSVVVGRPYEENLSVFLFGIVAWIILKFYPLARGRQAAGVGLAMGLLSLSRFQGQIVSWALLACLAAGPWRKYGMIRVARLGLCFILGWVTAVSPWALRNKWVFDNAAIAPSRIMWTLCERAAILGDNLGYSDLVPFALSLTSTELARRVFPNHDPYRDRKSPQYCSRIHDEIRGAGGSEDEIESEMFRRSVRLIAANPLKFAFVLVISPLSFLHFELEALSFDRSKLIEEWGKKVYGAANFAARLYSFAIIVLSIRGVRRAFGGGGGGERMLSLLVMAYLLPHMLTRIHNYFVLTVIPSLIFLAVNGLPGKWMEGSGKKETQQGD